MNLAQVSECEAALTLWGQRFEYQQHFLTLCPNGSGHAPTEQVDELQIKHVLILSLGFLVRTGTDLEPACLRQAFVLERGHASHKMLRKTACCLVRKIPRSEHQHLEVEKFQPRQQESIATVAAVATVILLDYIAHLVVHEAMEGSVAPDSRSIVIVRLVHVRQCFHT